MSEAELGQPPDQEQTRPRFLLVCQSLFCLSRGSWHILEAIRRRQENGELPEEVAVKPYYCFNGCSHGPNVVCYPDKVWFERVNATNLPQVLAYVCEGTLPTDPALNQKGVLEVVRQNAYRELDTEFSKGF
jgi:(2Fe-2S) ferredoxin